MSGVSFTVEKSVEPIYTGGKIELSRDASTGLNNLVLRSNSSFSIRAPATGSMVERIDFEDDESNIVVYVMKDSKTMISCNTENIFEVWSFASPSPPPSHPHSLVRSWKGHASPILFMAHHAKFPFLATGSADHAVRVWDSDKSHCTHNFKGVHGGIISSLLFHPNPNILMLFSASEDGSIAVWDLKESRVFKIFKGGHVSPVTSLSVCKNGKTLLSGGRDQVVNLWDLQQGGSNKPIKTITLMESCESAGFINDEIFYTAGEKGIVRFWNYNTGQCVSSSIKLTGEGHSITQALNLNNEELLAVTSELFLYFLSLRDLSITRLFIGHHGEITDMALFGEDQKTLAISTNGPEIRLIDKDQNDLSCSLLKGHSEAVISLASNSKYLISGSRDHTVIAWSNSDQRQPLCKMVGHTDVVSAVALGHKKLDLAASASVDMTIKLWDLSSSSAQLKWTIKAHEKDINCILFTPNDKLVITASQDKTAKIWKVDDGSLIGTLRGHKRGIWHASISSVEQIIATASADRTIKIWSLNDFTCLKTFEGHSNSVLKVQFIKNGTMLLSVGSDGLVKVWDVKKGECLNTFDGHSDRIWALLVDEDNENFYTGDASGILKKWKDVTEEQFQASQLERDNLILKEQQLSNLILRKDFQSAIILAIQMEQPNRLYLLLNQLIDGKEAQESFALLSNLFNSFNSESFKLLLGWIRDWNTSLKRCYISQLILNVILKNELVPTNDPSVRELLKQIQPFTERHFEKIDNLLIGSHLIDFVVEKIK